jgi:DNA-binding NtrC family response regulator
MDAGSAVRLLIVEYDQALRETLADELARRGFEVTTAASAGEAREALARGASEVALLDLVLPDQSSLDLLGEILARRPATEALALTGPGNLPAALEALRAGAYAHTVKPPRLEEVDALLRRAAEKARLRRRLEPPPAEGAGPGGALADLARQGLTLADVERAYIETVLALNAGHRGRASHALGIDPKTLYNRLGPCRPRRRGRRPEDAT